MAWIQSHHLAAEWVEAIASVFNVLVVAATLYFLRAYVSDTRKLVQSSQRQIDVAQAQLEASQRPFLAPSVVMNNRVEFQNQGSGIALNIAWLQWSDQDRKRIERRIPFAAVKGLTFNAGMLIDFSLYFDNEVTVTYDSLSGACYCTRFSWQKQEDGQTIFATSFTSL